MVCWWSQKRGASLSAERKGRSEVSGAKEEASSTEREGNFFSKPTVEITCERPTRPHTRHIRLCWALDTRDVLPMHRAVLANGLTGLSLPSELGYFILFFLIQRLHNQNVIT